MAQKRKSVDELYECMDNEVKKKKGEFMSDGGRNKTLSFQSISNAVHEENNKLLLRILRSRTRPNRPLLTRLLKEAVIKAYPCAIIKTLLKYGADPNAKGWKCIFHAMEHKHFNIVETLLEGGANPNVSEPQHGYTALHMAIMNSFRFCRTRTKHQDERLVRTLLGHGADPNARDNYGCTTLMMSLDTDTAITKALIEAGAGVNAAVFTNEDYPFSALGLENHRAKHPGCHHRDCPPVMQCRQGYTALHMVSAHCWCDLSDKLLLLIRSGADLEARDREGFTPFLRLSGPCVYRVRGRLRSLKLMYKAGSDVNTANENGITPLHGLSLVAKHEIEAYRWIVGLKNVNVNVKDDRENYPIEHCIEALVSQYFPTETTVIQDISRLLQLCSAEVINHRKYSLVFPSLLELAVRYESPELARLLIDAGADAKMALCNIPNRDSFITPTPRFIQVCRILLVHGALLCDQVRETMVKLAISHKAGVLWLLLVAIGAHRRCDQQTLAEVDNCFPEYCWRERPFTLSAWCRWRLWDATQKAGTSMVNITTQFTVPKLIESYLLLEDLDDFLNIM